MAFSLPEAATILEAITLLTWACLSGTRAKHPNYVKIFPDLWSLETIIALAALTFAPALLDAVQSATPPDLSFFLNLPTYHGFDLWGVYVLVLLKAGCIPKLYIGSATSMTVGLTGRFGQYDSHQALAGFVEKALKDGYVIAHKGILVSLVRPTPALVPGCRLLILAIEACLANIFWTMTRVKMDYTVTFSLWERDQFTYAGLCSHTALWEGGRLDLNLTAEELEAHAQMMKVRLAGQRDRAARKFQKENPEKFKENTKRSQANLKAIKKYYCKICDQSFPHDQALRRHNGSEVKRAFHEAEAHKYNISLETFQSSDDVQKARAANRKWKSKARKVAAAAKHST